MGSLKLKKVSGIASAVLASSLFLAGCSSSDKASGDQITLDVFQFKVEFKNQFEELAKAYEEENPDVKIKISTVGGGNDYKQSLITKFTSKEEPAIFNVGGPTDVEQFGDRLTDLSDTKAAKAALDGTLDGVTIDGKVLGLPFNQEGYGFIYNKRIFKEAGINAEELTSYEALKEAVEKLDAKKKDLKIKAVFAFPVKEKWVTGNHLSNVFLASEFDGNVMTAYESPTVAFTKGDQLKQMIDLQNEFSVQPTTSLDYSQQVEELFSLEQVAIIQQGNWVYNTVNDMDPELAEKNIGIIPIPVDGEAKMPVGVPNYWAVNNKVDDEVAKEAKKFLDWMYTSDTGKEAVLKDFKFIPAYEGYDSSKIADPLSKEIYEYSADGKTIGWTFQGSPVGWNEDQFGASVQAYVLGEMTWDELIQKNIKAWEDIRSGN
ncbi:ABC transporter substrate-binding protein [Peribacillus huizhouensis]|uniref:ABC transporter substrate-binding protein n=1 Tax=Peribacillus huizhouensis TaxID=1501239 RepID=UPI0015FA155B|nr:ABC transporter substrate-binding protein [Peribacillus huizhouensis]